MSGVAFNLSQASVGYLVDENLSKPIWENKTRFVMDSGGTLGTLSIKIVNLAAITLASLVAVSIGGAFVGCLAALFVAKQLPGLASHYSGESASAQSSAFVGFQYSKVSSDVKHAWKSFVAAVS